MKTLTKQEKDYALILFRKGYTIQQLSRMFKIEVIDLIKELKK
jgi:hypothetical protein